MKTACNVGVWWLMRHAPRLLRQLEVPATAAARRPQASPVQGRPLRSSTERRAMLDTLRETSPQIAEALERLGGTFLEEDDAE